MLKVFLIYDNTLELMFTNFAILPLQIPSDCFVMLLEPFFTLLSSECDKTVTKRVKELIFKYVPWFINIIL